MRCGLVGPVLFATTACGGQPSIATQQPADTASAAPPSPQLVDVGSEPSFDAAPKPPGSTAQREELWIDEQDDPLEDPRLLGADVLDALDPLLADCHIADPWRHLADLGDFEQLEFQLEADQSRTMYRSDRNGRGARYTAVFDRSACTGYVMMLQGEVRMRWRELSWGRGHDRIKALQDAVGTSQLVWLKDAETGTRALHTTLGLPRCAGTAQAPRSRTQGAFTIHSAKAGPVIKSELPPLVPSVAKTCKTTGSKASGWVSLGILADSEPAQPTQELATWIRYSSWIDQSVLALPHRGGARFAKMPTAGVWEQHGTTPSGLRWGMSTAPGRRGHGRVPMVVDAKCGRVYALSTDPEDFTIDGDGATTQPETCEEAGSGDRCRTIKVQGSRLTQRDCEGDQCTDATIDLDAVAKRGCR